MIRVLRVLEYRYEDAEAMANDMRNWTVGANAILAPNKRMTISSSTHLPEVEVGKYLDLDPRIQEAVASLKSGVAKPDERFMVRAEGVRRAVRTVDGVQQWEDVPDVGVLEITQYVRDAAGVEGGSGA